MLTFRKILLFLFFIGNSYASISTSSSGNNPFSGINKSAAGVNYATGTVTLNHKLASFAGKGATPITLKCSSNTYFNVRANNQDAPTSWVGLGWSLGISSIMCDHKNTMSLDDDIYYWKSPEGVRYRLYKGTENTGATTTKEKFYIENKPYWDVFRTLETNGTGTVASDFKIKSWEVVSPKGIVYKYGENSGAIWNAYCWFGTGTKEAAEEFALKNGKTTLEMTERGIALAKEGALKSWDEMSPLWSEASKEFAEKAVGKVDVFHSASGVRLESVWAQTEYKIIKDMGVDIIYHIAK